MNTYELADQLQEDVKWTVSLNTSLPERLIQGSFLLRQQADRIKELETKHKQEFDYAEKLLKERG
jgi:hypothetical protein